MPSPLSLTIFFPCHNEQAHVESMTRNAVAAGRQVADELEVLIVDDASTDQTLAIADRMAAEFDEVRVIHRPVSEGYGAALRSGFAAARCRWVFYTDGDGQFGFDELPAVLALRDRADIVSGYRVNRQDSWRRRASGWCFNKLINVMLGLSIRDVSCAYKLYPRSLFDRIELTCTGAMIDAETLMKAGRLGLRIEQIGIAHKPRTGGAPTGGKPGVIIHAFKELLRLRLTGRADLNS